MIIQKAKYQNPSRPVAFGLRGHRQGSPCLNHPNRRSLSLCKAPESASLQDAGCSFLQQLGVSPARRFFAGLAVLLNCPLVAEMKPHEVHSQTAEARDHHLFVGAVLYIDQDGEMTPVKKLRGNSALIANPTPDYLPIARTRGLNYQMSTKVSATMAKIHDLASGEITAPDMGAFRDQARLQMFLDQQGDLMEAEQTQLESEISQASDLAQTGATAEIRNDAANQAASLSSELGGLERDMTSLSDMADATQFDPSGVRTEDEQEKAIEVTFLVSSEREISDAYAFIAVRILTNEGFGNITFHEHIGRVTDKPRRVTAMKPGFRPGLEIKETQVFLFSNGEEIPTNQSDKHLALTREEAREFLLLSHISDNRRQTIPAQPAWELAPAELIAASDSNSLAFHLSVEVDAKGQVREVKQGNQIVPKHVVEMVQKLTFRPALQNGEPVPSTVTVNLADYFKDA